MKYNTTASVEERIKDALTYALYKTMSSYQNFLDDSESETPAEFKNRHTACKAALSHIEMLLKLSIMVDDDEDNADINAMEKLLENAQKELEGHDE